jgi:hypothetical protein
MVQSTLPEHSHALYEDVLYSSYAYCEGYMVGRGVHHTTSKYSL